MTRAVRPSRRAVIWSVAATLAIVFVVLVCGGYGLGWRWTGLSGSVTLWDWLQVLALPVAVSVAPILLARRRRLTRGHRITMSAIVAAFLILVVVGYLVPLAWTGFTGNTLWDWLELVLLPLVIATASLWSSVRLERWHVRAGIALAALFVAVVAAGYLVPWRWTGFRGNTAWDWLKLLLLPVLVPTALLPLVNRRLNERLGREDARSAVGG